MIDDYLNGGKGNDTYIFNIGDGQDTIYDYDYTSGNTDIVDFRDNPLNLLFTQNGSDLIININGTTDQVTIQSWYSGANYQVEELQAAGGQMLLNTQVEQLIQAMAIFTQQSGISWNQAIQERPDDVQAILSQYWVKQTV
jgi:Ca2+-binding RTX toxin-like protein